MKERSALGWSEFITGILLIALGVYTFVRPSGALTGIIFIYGILAILTGITDIVLYVKIEKHTGFGPAISLVTGILSLISGILLLINPSAGKWAITILFPAWFITHCISRLTHLPVIRLAAGTGYYYLTLITNIIGLILGVFMIFNPFLSFLSISFVIGGYLLILGIDHIVLAVSKIGMR